MLALIAGLLLAGCVVFEYSDVLPAVIVDRSCEGPCSTVVNVGGALYDRPGSWGQVGDSIAVTIVTFHDLFGPDRSWWDSPAASALGGAR